MEIQTIFKVKISSLYTCRILAWNQSGFFLFFPPFSTWSIKISTVLCERIRYEFSLSGPEIIKTKR